MEKPLKVRNRKFNGGKFFYEFLKIWPKLTQKWLKLANFQNFSKFFELYLKTLSRHRKWAKKIKKFLKSVAFRAKKRFGPIQGAQNSKLRIPSPIGDSAQKFFGMKLGWGRPSKWTMSREVTQFSYHHISYAEPWRRC